jgi:hypothetical protein
MYHVQSSEIYVKNYPNAFLNDRVVCDSAACMRKNWGSLT